MICPGTDAYISPNTTSIIGLEAPVDPARRASAANTLSTSPAKLAREASDPTDYLFGPDPKHVANRHQTRAHPHVNLWSNFWPGCVSRRYDQVYKISRWPIRTRLFSSHTSGVCMMFYKPDKQLFPTNIKGVQLASTVEYIIRASPLSKNMRGAKPRKLSTEKLLPTIFAQKITRDVSIDIVRTSRQQTGR